MNKFLARNLLTLFSLIVALCVILYCSYRSVDYEPAVSTDRAVSVILDAGHGGEDCGAIGVNGVYEKDLNMKIVDMLAQQLRDSGVEVLLTRTEDKLLYTEEQNIKGKRKYYDLRNRLLVAEENPRAIFISVHMNKFSSSKYSGLQVYYSERNAQSIILAQRIQDAVREDLQVDNSRKVKKADSSIYLLSNTDSVAVLIECGFLSNEQECQKLCTEDYQRALSFSVFCGIIDYIEEYSSIQ